MKKKTLLVLLLMTFGSGGLFAVAQQDEDVRGAFMTTRPKASNNQGSKSAKPIHRRPKQPTVIISGSNETVKTSGNKPKTTGPRMGLGMTLFMRDSNGLAVRTDPSREFHKGDHVRVLLETNADGYLYIFNTTNDGPPVMIYPDVALFEGGNYIQAHVPFEIPSSTADEERLRWFTFDQNAGAEKLYFVFSREPLSGVPIEDDLVSFCRSKSTNCPWHPAAATWVALRMELSEPVKTTRGRMEGAQTPAEHRGIGLNRDDPEPSLIMLSSSTTRNILVATLELIHKV